MVIPIFVDLQGFIVEKRFIVKEVAETGDRFHTLHFFTSYAMAFSDKIRQILHFLVESLPPLIAMGRDSPVQYGEVSNYGGRNRRR